MFEYGRPSYNGYTANKELRVLIQYSIPCSCILAFSLFLFLYYSIFSNFPRITDQFEANITILLSLNNVLVMFALTVLLSEISQTQIPYQQHCRLHKSEKFKNSILQKSMMSLAPIYCRQCRCLIFSQNKLSCNILQQKISQN